LSLISVINAHPTKYPHVKANNISCQSINPFPTIYSYHIHFLFNSPLGFNNQSMINALAVRDEFIDLFKPNGTCPSLYHQDWLCMFETTYGPDGPFPTAQWAAFIPIPYFMPTVTWVMQKRQQLGLINAACTGSPGCGVPREDFTTYIHPNSGCEYEDHGKWPLWGGPSWTLNMDAMDTETPFEDGVTHTAPF